MALGWRLGWIWQAWGAHSAQVLGSGKVVSCPSIVWKAVTSRRCGACHYSNAVEYPWPRLTLVSLLQPAAGANDQGDPHLRQYSPEMGIGVAVPDRQRLLVPAVHWAQARPGESSPSPASPTRTPPPPPLPSSSSCLSIPDAITCSMWCTHIPRFACLADRLLCYHVALCLETCIFRDDGRLRCL